MIYRTISNTPSFIHKITASIFIYLRNHNQTISPNSTKLNLSYRDPANLIPDAPIQQKIKFKLRNELEQMIQRLTFEQYKNKVLRGELDEVLQLQKDQLWGDQQVPIHYFSRMGKKNLMEVSYPQRRDISNHLTQIYKQYFTSHLEHQITIDLIQNSDFHQLVQVAVKARTQRIKDGSLWFAIEERFERGKKLYLLNSGELIKLKFAFDGDTKYGTPTFHEILASLLREDLGKMNGIELMNLFYASRHANPGITNLQFDILKAIDPFYTTFTFDQRVNFLLTFTLCTRSIRYYAKVQKRRRYQFKELAKQIIFKLNFTNLQFNHQNVQKIIFSLAKLRLPNTKFISYPIREYINQHFDTYTQDKHRVQQAICYLTEIENGQGVIDQQFLRRLKQKAKIFWDEYSGIDKIRIIFNLWNYRLMDEEVIELYKSIEFELSSSFLYYACQIELGGSSSRQWQVIKYIGLLKFIPLPYFVAYKRFYNYIKSTTSWNLKPIQEKLLNTQYYYDVMRKQDALYQIQSYRNFRQFEQFSQVKFMQLGSPIQNLELAHFAFPKYQVSLDIVNKRQFIPGTNKFKQTYMNKVRSLKIIGWKHLAYSQDQIKSLSLTEYIQNIQNAYLPYIQEQKAVMAHADSIKSQQIQLHKAGEFLNRSTTRMMNRMFYPKSALFDGEKSPQEIAGMPQEQN